MLVEGFLVVRKSWKRRYFKLDHERLRFFDQPSGEKRGGVEFAGKRVTASKVNVGVWGFEIQVDSRRIVLHASNEWEMLRWIKAFKSIHDKKENDLLEKVEAKRNEDIIAAARVAQESIKFEEVVIVFKTEEMLGISFDDPSVGCLRVSTVVPGGIASRRDVVPGMLLLAIDGVDVDKLSHAEVSNRMVKRPLRLVFLKPHAKTIKTNSNTSEDTVPVPPPQRAIPTMSDSEFDIGMVMNRVMIWEVDAKGATCPQWTPGPRNVFTGRSSACYLVLPCGAEGGWSEDYDEAELTTNCHCWIGKDSLSKCAVAVSMKAAQLAARLAAEGTCVLLHREEQGSESELFGSYFAGLEPRCERARPGPAAAAVDPSTAEAVSKGSSPSTRNRLFSIAADGSGVVSRVAFSAAVFDPTAVLLLHAASPAQGSIQVWAGAATTLRERSVGLQAAYRLRQELPGLDVVVAAGEDERAHFKDIVMAGAGLEQAVTQCHSSGAGSGAQQPDGVGVQQSGGAGVMFKISYYEGAEGPDTVCAGHCAACERLFNSAGSVAAGSVAGSVAGVGGATAVVCVDGLLVEVRRVEATRDLLASTDVLLLDCDTELYVWTGRESGPQLRRCGRQFAAEHALRHRAGRYTWAALQTVAQFHEPFLFRSKFRGWGSREVVSTCESAAVEYERGTAPATKAPSEAAVVHQAVRIIAAEHDNFASSKRREGGAAAHSPPPSKASSSSPRPSNRVLTLSDITEARERSTVTIEQGEDAAASALRVSRRRISSGAWWRLAASAAVNQFKSAKGGGGGTGAHTANEGFSRLGVRRVSANITVAEAGAASDMGVGQVKIWNVMASDLVAVDQREFGHFFSSRVYIVLYGYNPGQMERDGDSRGRPRFLCYVWYGARVSNLDRIRWKVDFAPAMFAQWEAVAGCAPTEIPMEEGREPDHFFRVFRNRIVVHGPFVAAIKASEGAERAPEIVLYKVRSFFEQGVRGVQVSCAASSLNSIDVFVLLRVDAGSAATQAVWLWIGSDAPLKEQQAGAKVALDLMHFFRFAKTVQVRLVQEGQADWKLSNRSFWQALGGQHLYTEVATCKGSGFLNGVKFFRSSFASGSFRLLPVAAFSQRDLCGDGAVLVDTPTVVFVWLGRAANLNNRRMTIATAREYVGGSGAGSPSKSRKLKKKVVVVRQGAEPRGFVTLFHGWNLDKPCFSDPRERRVAARRAAGLLGDVEALMGHVVVHKPSAAS